MNRTAQFGDGRDGGYVVRSPRATDGVGQLLRQCFGREAPGGGEFAALIERLNRIKAR